MLCTHCRAAHIEHGASCPNCGAMPPQQETGGNGWGEAGDSWASWSAWETEQNKPAPQQGTQVSFGGSLLSHSNTHQQPWSQQPVQPEVQMQQEVQSWSYNQSSQEGTVQQSSWSYGGTGQDGEGQQSYQASWHQSVEQAEVKAPQTASEPEPQEKQQSRLPVPYQGGMALQPGMMQQNTALQIMSLEQLIPHIPAEEHAIYVPPMYTRPRPLIPKYRIISGMLSVLIVTILACVGMSYYAKTSGALASMQRFVTGAPPPNASQSEVKTQIPDPPAQKPEDRGPAYLVIPSAGTASRIDEKTYIPLQPAKIFKVGQEIFVTYSIQKPKEVGTVTVKWYMNNVFYIEKDSKPFNSKEDPNNPGANGYAKIIYAEPASGTAEIYWNGQFAQRVYFAVRA